MQLAATRKGGRKRCAICSQIYQRRMQAEFIESGALRRVIAVYRAKHRLQPCEPKPRPAEARRHSPRWLRHENNTAPTEAELANLQRTLFLNEANVACGAASPATAEAASFRAGRLRPAQHCELQNRRTTETSNRTTVRKQLFLINPPAPLRCQRTAESTGRADETVSPKTARRVKQTCLNLRRREDVPARNRGPCHSGP